MAKAKKIKKKPTNNRYIPDDIIFSLLLRLSLKSVLRFTCVSPSWNRLIRSSDFVSAYDLHDHQQKIVNNSNDDDDNNDNKNSCSDLVYMPDDNRKWAQICTLIRENPMATPQHHTYNLPLLPLSGGYKVIGACEGLICLRKNKSDICIWNPCVGTLKTIRIPNPDSNTLFGFGYSRQSNDYLIIKMNSAINSDQVEIYSLAVDSWRRIENCGFVGCRILSPQVMLKGSIYWLASRNNDHYMILKFDMEEEIFNEMEAPVKLSGNRRMYELVVVNGFLVVLKVVSGGDDTIHLWAHIKAEKKVLDSEWKWLPAQHVVFADDEYRRPLAKITGGHIVCEGTRDKRIFAYDCQYDGNELGFKLRDLGVHRTSKSFHLVPITMESTSLGLYVLDKFL